MLGVFIPPDIYPSDDNKRVWSMNVLVIPRYSDVFHLAAKSNVKRGIVRDAARRHVLFFSLRIFLFKRAFPVLVNELASSLVLASP